ncbi:hypothetical protein [Rhodovulum imhoffii]|uniref:hypothetical protein n=1 Tax=Rhodovulum imhoffii TaxID=365340 RepID=UPI001473508B|nr:hypothetical protein [Rhodovulum imhoffii]
MVKIERFMENSPCFMGENNCTPVISPMKRSGGRFPSPQRPGIRFATSRRKDPAPRLKLLAFWHDGEKTTEEFSRGFQ